MGVLKGWDKGKIGNSCNRKNEYIRRKQCGYTRSLEKNQNKKEENKKRTVHKGRAQQQYRTVNLVSGKQKFRTS